MMPFNLKNLLEVYKGKNFILEEKYINPQFIYTLQFSGLNIAFERGEGFYLYDKNNQQYLDFLGGAGSLNMGRNHPKIREILEEALTLKLPNLAQMSPSLLAGILAEKLIEYAPRPNDTIFFANSGSESVEAALKFARAHTKRNKFLYLKHAYHGLTFGALSCNGNQILKKGFGKLLETEEIKMNDLATLKKQLAKKNVAALIVECIQGKGVYLSNENYLHEARELCRKHKTLFIADEVQSGVGRTGQFFAFNHWNLDPDIITIAKSLSGGYVPIAAVFSRREVYDAVYSEMDRCLVHYSTFGRNDLAMAAGIAALHVLKEEKLMENAEKIGNYLMNRLKKLQEKYPQIQEIRGKGLMIGIEFSRQSSLELKSKMKSSKKIPEGIFAQTVGIALFKEHKIFLEIPGFVNVLKILPPLTIKEKEADYFVEALDQVLKNPNQLHGVGAVQFLPD